jgi:dihydroxy-acid dehydratase
MATEQTPAPIDRKRLRSQRLREVNFQGDALRLGMNWTEDDLRKPQVLVESAYGMGHPGTFHFRGLIEEVSNGVFEAGGKPAEFVVSDICDGVVQATDGMSYSLISRDIMAAMIEIHALGHPHDAMVLISGNDKSVPAQLLAMARCDLPAVHLPGGTQLNAPDYVTSNQMWEMGAAVRRGELAEDELELAQRGACPTCGACQFMGSASTGQVLSEALGLALPGSALVPEPLTKLLRYARAAGKQALRLIAEDLTPRRILTREAFENAIVMHAAIGGSTNALLHLPVIAQEAGVEITIDDFDRIHRQVPVLTNVKTTGRYPAEYFWYAGGNARATRHAAPGLPHRHRQDPGREPRGGRAQQVLHARTARLPQEFQDTPGRDHPAPRRSLRHRRRDRDPAGQHRSRRGDGEDLLRAKGDARARRSGESLRGRARGYRCPRRAEDKAGRRNGHPL